MNPDSNQDKPWYPNGAPLPGQSQGPQQPPFPPAPTAQHGLPPQQRYAPPTGPVETPTQPQQPYGQPFQAPPAPAPQPETPQYSIDYLNQIAPTAKKPSVVDGRLFIFIIGGGLVLAAIVGMLAMLSGGSGPTEKMQTLAARMVVLQKIASDSQKNIKSSRLRNTNSSLSIFLTNANHDIEAPLQNSNLDVKKIDKKIEQQEKESGKELSSKLDDARLNATFDLTYSREMSYQLITVESLMKNIYKTTKSKSMKSYLEKTDGNISPIIDQLDKFNPTTAND